MKMLASEPEPKLPRAARSLDRQRNEAPVVLVVQRRMVHYREPFFEALRHELRERNVELRLAYGDGSPAEAQRKDRGEVAWGHHLRTRYLLGGRLCWQPIGKVMKGAAMAVITQENKQVCNLFAQYLQRDVKIGLWGHGGNLQGDAHGLRERIKRVTSRQADWWFAYTEVSVPLIERCGFPRERITAIDNAVDTAELVAQRARVMPQRLHNLRAELGLCGTHVGVFVGSLYEEKRIDFMLDAAAAIRAKLPQFEFLIAGTGPKKSLVETFCSRSPWARYVGARFGQDKVDLIALAQVTIHPGAVGLVVLDSFACGVPLATTDCGLHGPEIAYLVHGENGLVTGNSLEQYASTIVELLQDAPLVARLKAGCERAATRYTVQRMAANFADGAVRCLAAPIYRGGP